MADEQTEMTLRIELAAAFRLTARAGLHEAVANHFSAAISPDGRRFLINPKWRHFSRIRASDLVVVDLADENRADESRADENWSARTDLDPTAIALHGALHRHDPKIRVAFHLHPVAAVAISALADPTILPIDQNTARYFRRVAYDTAYTGMADSAAEGARLAHLLDGKSRLMMGNHGVLVTAPTMGEAYDDLYTLDRACDILLRAYATQRPLAILSDEVAEKTARDWEGIANFSRAHFAEMMHILDREEPDYRH